MPDPTLEQTDDEMLAELGLSAEREARRTHTAEEERVLAGFEDILKFVETHDRAGRRRRWPSPSDRRR